MKRIEDSMTATISFERVSDIYDATQGLSSGISEQILENYYKDFSAYYIPGKDKLDND